MSKQNKKGKNYEKSKNICNAKKQKKSKNIIIEKHVKLNNSRGPDASSSIDTQDLSELVKIIRQIEKLKI